ncbi:helix-turn-helix domain-containing protein [Streptomyces platensis]|uniref:AraC-like ligand-binding domain-containing protein n=1 Tax=Streptomyces platensis TaxID=58346 RepID=UPI003866A64C|nr:helix-turn-helix domain-containing protein [Streptomyces platensis]
MSHTMVTPSPVLSLSNDLLTERDRFGWYVDRVREGIAPFTLTSPHARDFPARVMSADLGTAQLATFSFPPLGAVRTSRHIRRDDPETYHLALIRRGLVLVLQRRHEAVVQAGGMVLFDSSHPLDAEFQDARGTPMVTMLRLPRAALALPQDQADRLLSRPLSPRGATGSLLRQLLYSTLGRLAGQDQAESYRLGTIAVDLVAAFLAGHLDAAGALPAETRRRELMAQIGGFIEANLGDPGLCPAVIAARHHVSVRTLHELFRTEPEAVMATVRRHRLERCRADLADPVLRARPIAALAARWGFLSPAEFSRVFRRTYGATPSQFRYEVSAMHDPH